MRGQKRADWLTRLNMSWRCWARWQWLPWFSTERPLSTTRWSPDVLRSCSASSFLPRYRWLIAGRCGKGWRRPRQAVPFSFSAPAPQRRTFILLIAHRLIISVSNLSIWKERASASKLPGRILRLLKATWRRSWCTCHIGMQAWFSRSELIRCNPPCWTG